MNPYGMSPMVFSISIPENSNFLMGITTPKLQRIIKSLLLLSAFPDMFFVCLIVAGIWNLFLHSNDFRVKDRGVKKVLYFAHDRTHPKGRDRGQDLLLGSGFLNQDSNDNGTRWGGVTQCSPLLIFA